jgi:hypothetical protein
VTLERFGERDMEHCYTRGCNTNQERLDPALGNDIGLVSPRREKVVDFYKLMGLEPRPKGIKEANTINYQILSFKEWLCELKKMNLTKQDIKEITKIAQAFSALAKPEIPMKGKQMKIVLDNLNTCNVAIKQKYDDVLSRQQKLSEQDRFSSTAQHGGTATVSGGFSLIYAQFGRIFKHIHWIVPLYQHGVQSEHDHSAEQASQSGPPEIPIGKHHPKYGQPGFPGHVPDNPTVADTNGSTDPTGPYKSVQETSLTNRMQKFFEEHESKKKKWQTLCRENEGLLGDIIRGEKAIEASSDQMLKCDYDNALQKLSTTAEDWGNELDALLDRYYRICRCYERAAIVDENVSGILSDINEYRATEHRIREKLLLEPHHLLKYINKQNDQFGEDTSPNEQDILNLQIKMETYERFAHIIPDAEDDLAGLDMSELSNTAREIANDHIAINDKYLPLILNSDSLDDYNRERQDIKNHLVRGSIKLQDNDSDDTINDLKKEIIGDIMIRSLQIEYFAKYLWDKFLELCETDLNTYDLDGQYGEQQRIHEYIYKNLPNESSILRQYKQEQKDLVQTIEVYLKNMKDVDGITREKLKDIAWCSIDLESQKKYLYILNSGQEKSLMAILQKYSESHPDNKDNWENLLSAREKIRPAEIADGEVLINHISYPALARDYANELKKMSKVVAEWKGGVVELLEKCVDVHNCYKSAALLDKDIGKILSSDKIDEYRKREGVIRAKLESEDALWEYLSNTDKLITHPTSTSKEQAILSLQKEQLKQIWEKNPKLDWTINPNYIPNEDEKEQYETIKNKIQIRDMIIQTSLSSNNKIFNYWLTISKKMFEVFEEREPDPFDSWACACLDEQKLFLKQVMVARTTDPTYKTLRTALKDLSKELLCDRDGKSLQSPREGWSAKMTESLSALCKEFQKQEQKFFMRNLSHDDWKLYCDTMTKKIKQVTGTSLSPVQAMSVLCHEYIQCAKSLLLADEFATELPWRGILKEIASWEAPIDPVQPQRWNTQSATGAQQQADTTKPAVLPKPTWWDDPWMSKSSEREKARAKQLEDLKQFIEDCKLSNDEMQYMQINTFYNLYSTIGATIKRVESEIRPGSKDFNQDYRKIVQKFDIQRREMSEIIKRVSGSSKNPSLPTKMQIVQGEAVAHCLRGLYKVFDGHVFQNKEAISELKDIQPKIEGLQKVVGHYLWKFESIKKEKEEKETIDTIKTIDNIIQLFKDAKDKVDNLCRYVATTTDQASVKSP